MRHYLHHVPGLTFRPPLKTCQVPTDFSDEANILRTDYYRRYPIVLVRLSLLNCEVLRESLVGSWRITAAKGRKGPTAKMPTTT